MSAAEEKKGSGGRTLLALAVLALFVLAGVVGWLYRGVGKAQKSLEQARADYDGMKTMKNTVFELRKKSGGGKKIQSPPENPNELLVTFLSQECRKQQIPPSVRPPPDSGSPFGSWREYAYRLTIEKKSGVSLASLVNFLAAVERERPYLKSRSLEVNYEENNTVSGGVTVSFFKSEGGR